MAAVVRTHGHVQTVIAYGVEYAGGIPHGASPDAVGWAAANQDNSFVAPNAYGSPDIICHKSATSMPDAAIISAGSSITLQWDTWRSLTTALSWTISLPYLVTLDPSTRLAFSGLRSLSVVLLRVPTLAARALTSLCPTATPAVDIPANLALGKYVLRHEIIALHSAGQANGAQSYPQCVNIEVTGGGSSIPTGGACTTFYSAQDPGINFNLHASFDSIPSPVSVFGVPKPSRPAGIFRDVGLESETTFSLL